MSKKGVVDGIYAKWKEAIDFYTDQKQQICHTTQP